MQDQRKKRNEDKKIAHFYPELLTKAQILCDPNLNYLMIQLREKSKNSHGGIR